MTLDDLPFGTPTTAPNLGAPEPRVRVHRHRWVQRIGGDEVLTVCSVCGREHDPVASRRARTNRSRGNAIEREVCKVLGISRVGQFGGSEDGGKSTEWCVVQVKSGGSYPERIDRLVRSLTATAAQLRGVVHTDAPGPGRRRRALITFDLSEFAEWYGDPSARG